MSAARWTSESKRDIEQIAVYIGIDEHRPIAADRLIDRIVETVDFLAQHNTMGTPRDDLGSGYRIYTVSRYVIVFNPVADGIEVVRIVDGRRDLTSLFQS
jgi:toxin ParE1/3/4